MMGTTPEYEFERTEPEDQLDWLKEYVPHIADDICCANGHLVRLINKLKVVAEASAIEKEQLKSDVSTPESEKHNALNTLSRIGVIADRQITGLTAINESVVEAYKLIWGDTSGFVNLFDLMERLIELHPELLEKRAAITALEINDTDDKTAPMRHKLNKLLEDS